MDIQHSLASLDDAAREEIAKFLAVMATEAEQLVVHALLPVSREMLLARKANCLNIAESLLDANV